MKRLQKLTILLISLVVLSAYSVTSLATTIPKTINGEKTPSLAPMLAKVMPAVVNVSVIGTINPGQGADQWAPRQYQPGGGSGAPNMPQGRQNPAAPGANNRRPMPPGGLPPRAKFEYMGSGVIVDAKHGYVLTNAHVIHHAHVINVTLKDGRHFKAKLIGIDVPSDIAVLQIKAKHLTAINMGNSNKLQVGDFVLAIGNPFALNQTVTSGIVSALQRTDLHIEGYENFIQTDAAINVGNSGGALVNLQGQLIGINTAILSKDGGNIGIGFAIPVNMARSVMKQLIKYGKVERGVMGVIVQNFSSALANAFNMSGVKGAVVTEITPNSPAQHAGIKPYDVIESINGKAISNSVEVRNAVGVLRIGDALTIKLRRGAQTKIIRMRVGNPGAIVKKFQEEDPLFIGVTLRNFDRQTTSHGHVRGVQILNIKEGTPADSAELLPGDVIVSANRKPIHDINDLNKIIKSHNKSLLLHVYRRNGAIFLVLK